MGCSNIGRSKREEFAQSSKMIKAIEQIKLKPQLFIKQNKNPIQQIYRLGAVLSTRQYSQTRICYHRKAGFKRVVRVLKKKKVRSQKIRAAFDTEIQVSRCLNHPNILKTIEYFYQIERFYMISQYCQGGQLVTQILKRKTLNQQEAAVIMKQLFSAVWHMHNKGVIHRDINIQNLFLETPGDLNSLKLANFRSAVFCGREKKSGQVGNLYYMSPEMINSQYSFSTDLWSCGVLMYVLLQGSPPFTGATNNQLFESIQNTSLQFQESKWEYVSKQAKNLILKLLDTRKKRISAAEALKHPWIGHHVEIPSVPYEYQAQTLKKLAQFHTPNKIKLAVHTFLTTIFVSNSDTKQLKQVFQKMDINGDGRLSKKELVEAYSQSVGPEQAEQMAKKVLSAIDSDHNGYIDYSEFIQSTIDINKLTSVENLEKAFATFDQNWNGTIEAVELRRLMDGGMDSDDHIWLELLLQVDQDYNGVIDFNEFKNLIFSKISQKFELMNGDFFQLKRFWLVIFLLFFILRKFVEENITMDVQVGHKNTDTIF